MNVRSALGCAVALLVIPLFPACSAGSSSDGTPAGSDAGPQGSEDSGTGPGGSPSGGTGGTGGPGGPPPDAGGATTPEGGDDGAIGASPDAGIPAIKAVMYLDNW